MRLRIAHRNVYRYDPPAAGVIQVLRLTPRNHEGQYVVRWRIDVSADARLAGHEDAFGNLTHVFSADGPFGELSVEVDGEVETQNTNGIVRGTVERFGPSLFLRDTALTQADPAIQDFAQGIRAAKSGEFSPSFTWSWTSCMKTWPMTPTMRNRPRTRRKLSLS